MREAVFKTAWFAKAARKAGIEDGDLRRAIVGLSRGQGDDLGGGVFKKRLNKNMHRAIVVGSSGRQWVCVYLFAKKDRANIDRGELLAFRELAALYAGKTIEDIDRELSIGILLELDHDDTA